MTDITEWGIKIHGSDTLVVPSEYFMSYESLKLQKQILAFNLNEQHIPSNLPIPLHRSSFRKPRHAS